MNSLQRAGNKPGGPLAEPVGSIPRHYSFECRKLKNQSGSKRKNCKFQGNSTVPVTFLHWELCTGVFFASGVISMTKKTGYLKKIRRKNRKLLTRTPSFTAPSFQGGPLPMLQWRSSRGNHQPWSYQTQPFFA